jgi:hypothetical protein
MIKQTFEQNETVCPPVISGKRPFILVSGEGRNG